MSAIRAAGQPAHDLLHPTAEFSLPWSSHGDATRRFARRLAGSSQDQEAVRRDIARRCSGGASGGGIPVVNSLISDATDWFLYPVNSLLPRGKWSSPTGRIMLLGDAAHAMPPQGESTGIALEDAIVFARVLSHTLPESLGAGEAADEENGGSAPLVKACLHYEATRRPRIDAAYVEASRRWESVKDSGWLAHAVRNWLTPWFLWWTDAARRKSFEEDVAIVDLRL